MNCRGLGDFQKLKDVFHYLRSKRKSIYCLQDTHFTKEQTVKIRSVWGNDIIMSPGRSNSRGSIILFNDNFEYNILKFKTDLEGNMVATEIKLQNTYTLTLINIYGPNHDSPEFYRTITLNRNIRLFIVL